MGRYYLKTNPLSRVYDVEPMTYKEYVQKFGEQFDWDTSHLKTEAGYAEKALSGSDIKWTYKDVFDELYVTCDLMPFSLALDLLKAGRRVSRNKWIEKGMFVVYQKGYPDGISCNQQTADAWGMRVGDQFKCNPYLQIRQADGSHSMYTPSTDDLMAEDWILL